MAVPRLPPLPTVRDIVKLYKLRAMKHLSQNFIFDENIMNKIVQKAGVLTGGEVLEVGPGPGGLTRSIIKQCPKRIIVVEKDPRFKPNLELLADAFRTVDGKMDIYIEDILKLNMNNIFSESEKKSWDDKKPNIHLIGNLPFNVSTYLIITWLHAISEKRGPWALGRARMTLTFQKEVAERIVAPEGSSQRCRLSIMAQAWTYPVLRYIIPGACFVPKPDVDVGVVTFVPLVTPRTNHDFKLFEKITRHIFSCRQKYCARCIQTLFPLENRYEMADVMCKLCDMDPQKRPYQLSVEDIDKLVTAYKFLTEKHPEIALYDYRASRRLLGQKYTKSVEVEAYMDA